MSDLISREDALKELNKEYRCTDKSDDLDGLETAIKIIEALPSAEAEWIPCSESLPKEYAQYLVCLESGECYVYWLEDSDWARGMAEKEGILAWMPLPKPYRKDGEA